VKLKSNNNNDNNNNHVKTWSNVIIRLLIIVVKAVAAGRQTVSDAFRVENHTPAPLFPHDSAIAQVLR